VIYSEWPSPILQLDEFLSGVKQNLKFPFMICESYKRRMRATGSEHLAHVYSGSILIADQWEKKGNYDTLEALFDKTDRIASDIECFMLQEFEQHLNAENNGVKRVVIENSFDTEKIGPFSDKLYGTRLSFQYSQTTGRYVFDQSDWIV
jgi:hypothetical protein